MTEVKRMMKKMCVIGDAAVGKTSLIRRFVYDRFHDRYIATIGAKTSAKELNITMNGNDIQLNLQIWDIIGLRSFAKLQMRAYKGANGAFFVLDKTRKGTWQTFGNWLLSLYRVTGEIPVIVLANKNDLEGEFENSEIKRFIKGYGFPCLFTSAKSGENVDLAFHALGELMTKPWRGVNILPRLEREESLKMAMDPELESGRPLSIFEVENIIMARYCDLLEDPNYAMAVINEQFRRAGLDSMDPSVERLNRVIDFLIKAATGRVEPTRLKKEFKTYTNLIEMIAYEK